MKNKKQVLEWHDLRKDPRDLPAEEKRVLISDGQDVLVGWYDQRDGFFKSIEGSFHCQIYLVKAIAWMPLPEFKA